MQYVPGLYVIHGTDRDAAVETAATRLRQHYERLFSAPYPKQATPKDVRFVKGDMRGPRSAYGNYPDRFVISFGAAIVSRQQRVD